MKNLFREMFNFKSQAHLFPSNVHLKILQCVIVRLLVKSLDTIDVGPTFRSNCITTVVLQQVYRA